MKLDRKLGILFKSLNKFSSLIGNKKTGHILDTDGICTHLFDLLCHVCPILKSISIAKRIRKCDLRFTAAFLNFDLVCGINRCLKVSDIVKAVKDSDNIDTVW